MSEAPTRIMMVAPHFEEYALRLSVALAAHADVLLVLDRSLLDAEFAGRHMPGAPRLTIRDNRFRSPAELARLTADLLRFRPQVLHWQEPSGFIKAGMAAATVTLAKPFARTAITIHDPVPHAGRDSRVAARLAPLRRYARARADRLFLHGPACAEQYRRDYLGGRNDPRVRLTEHGVLLAAEPPVARPETFHAVMVGRMEAYKGLAVLADALALLDRPQSVEIAGGGPELERLSARLGALPRVKVTNGYLPATGMIARIAAAEAVLLPYTEASQSGVLAAAFANGRFVIASAVGGIADVVEDGVNGLLVPPGDPVALAAAITRAASDPALRDRLCAGARRTAAERLDWPAIVERLLRDY